MAHHLHRQIREAVKATLTGLATSGAHVYANRLLPLPDASLPGLRITLDSEDAQAETIHGPITYGRNLTLSVECCAKGATVDDTLDQMSQEVEAVLALGVTLGTHVLAPIYQGMQFDDDRADQAVGVKRLTFSIPFYTLGNAPDVLS